MITVNELKVFVKNHIDVKTKNVAKITELKDILWVINFAPRYTNCCDFSTIEDFVWVELLKEHPHLVNKCRIDCLDFNSWENINTTLPQVINTWMTTNLSTTQRLDIVLEEVT